jgi:formylglycine-generating enzyme required for sulfatase activity
MPDPVPARKTGPWPLVAISVLVALLAAFLILSYRRRDRESSLVVKPPPAPVEPVKADPPVVVTPPPAIPPDPPKGPADALRAEIQKALDQRRWDEADKLLAGAKDVAALDDLRATLTEGRAAEAKAREEARAAEEARKKRDQAWLGAREKSEKAKDANRWDEALAILEAVGKEHPDLAKVEEFSRALETVTGMRKESDAIFRKEIADAEKLFAAGRFALADATAEKVLKLYPERSGAVRAFQDKVRLAKIESEMIRIPGAACWIGSDASPDEKPLRQVKLAPFFLDRFEVSNEDYLAFVLATGHSAPPHWNGKSVPKGRERHPVLYVSYDDATAYAKWAGKRLPSAEEWEVAARGPDKREFPWGNTFSEKENVFPCNSIEFWQVQKAIPTTMPVDAAPLANGESAFRVWGMGGNVWEWTSTAVPGKSGEQLLEFRILKGGSFLTPSKALRCANVLAEDPRLGHPDVGFRCARDAK